MTIKIVRGLVFILIILAIISTVFLVFSPLLPSAEEYKYNENGKVGFPDYFWENLDMWVHKTLPRHLVLFNEYYNIDWILSFLSNVFFLILLLNVREAVNTYDPKKGEKLIGNYFNWTVGSLLIAVVFQTKFITYHNIARMSLGILGLTASAFLLLYFKRKYD